MLAARQKWLLEEQEIHKDFVMDLVQLGEKLGSHCSVLLEGKEGETERSYIGFGEGWVISGDSQNSQDPLQELRSFMRSWKEERSFVIDNCQQEELESGIIGFFDYEWGLLWQRPVSSRHNPKYFFRLCPVNLVLIPGDKALILEIFNENHGEIAATLAKWQRGLEDYVFNIERTKSQAVLPKNQVVNLDINQINDLNNNQIHSQTNKQVNKPRKVELNKDWQSDTTRDEYQTKVRDIQEYIKAGDIFQAVLAQKFFRKIKISVWDFYRKLRVANPSPYLFYVEGLDETLAGSSPELLVATVGDKVNTRPIAGTRSRGSNEQEDYELEQELRHDEKENAEHAMLVDLGRNDIGKIAAYGSVTVPQYAEVERFSQVMHLVSTVQGKLKPDCDGLDALKAVFPAGTLSGAPKVRAMEILQELEPETRGAYGGALGIMRWNGDVDFCITIRTLRVTADEVCIQAGAGIVYDSQPDMEYEETLHKANALIKVVNDCADHD